MVPVHAFLSVSYACKKLFLQPHWEDQTGETCACIARYRSKATMEEVIMRHLEARSVTTHIATVRSHVLNPDRYTPSAHWICHCVTARMNGQNLKTRSGKLKRVGRSGAVAELDAFSPLAVLEGREGRQGRRPQKANNPVHCCRRQCGEACSMDGEGVDESMQARGPSWYCRCPDGHKRARKDWWQRRRKRIRHREKFLQLGMKSDAKITLK